MPGDASRKTQYRSAAAATFQCRRGSLKISRMIITVGVELDYYYYE